MIQILITNNSQINLVKAALRVVRKWKLVIKEIKKATSIKKQKLSKTEYSK